MTIVPIVRLDIEKVITPKCHREEKKIKCNMKCVKLKITTLL
jgi:hypothetical protein